jgi:hypothetical protein
MEITTEITILFILLQFLSLPCQASECVLLGMVWLAQLAGHARGPFTLSLLKSDSDCPIARYSACPPKKKVQ